MRQAGLRNLLAILWRQQVVFGIVLTVGLLTSLFAALHVHPRYTATATILMVAEPPESQNPKVPVTATKPLLASDLPTLATSPTVLTRFERDLRITESFERLRSQIRARVNVDSNVMPVTFSSSVDSEAVKGANALAKEIATFYQEIATRRFDSLILDLRSQQALRAMQLARYDAELENAARSYPFIDIHEGDGGATQTSVYERLISLRTERDETSALVQADSASAEQMRRRLRQVLPLAINDVVNNDVVYKNLRDQYADDLGRLQREETFAKQGYPGLAELQHTVEAERVAARAARAVASAAGPSTNQDYVAALADSTKADAQSASDSAKLRQISVELSQLEMQAGDGGISSRVSRIRRDRENAQAAYGILAGTLAQTMADRAQAASTGSVVVMDQAVVADSVLWSTRSFALIGLGLITLWLAVSASFLADKLIRRFHSDDNIQGVYGEPIIGSLA